MDVHFCTDLTFQQEHDTKLELAYDLKGLCSAVILLFHASHYNVECDLFCVLLYCRILLISNGGFKNFSMFFIKNF